MLTILDNREFAAVLAGLRLVQAELPRSEFLPQGVHDIFDDGETLTPLTEDEIDTLCERLNGSLLTRADLFKFEAFQDLQTDSSGNPTVWLNTYVCQSCEERWEDAWSCGCNDRCPSCDAEIEPVSSEWIGPSSAFLKNLWDLLPDAK